MTPEILNQKQAAFVNFMKTISEFESKSNVKDKKSYFEPISHYNKFDNKIALRIAEKYGFEYKYWSSVKQWVKDYEQARAVDYFEEAFFNDAAANVSTLFNAGEIVNAVKAYNAYLDHYRKFYSFSYKQTYEHEKAFQAKAVPTKFMSIFAI